MKRVQLLEGPALGAARIMMSVISQLQLVPTLDTISKSYFHGVSFLFYQFKCVNRRTLRTASILQLAWGRKL